MPLAKRLVVLLVLLSATVRGMARNWTDATGQFSIEAELVAFDGNTVVLKRTDGKIITLPVEKLGEADQAFLLQSGQGSRKPLPQPGNDRPQSAKASEPAVADAASRASNDAANVVERIELSVVRVDTDRGTGSGFVIGSEGIIATNYHVIDDVAEAHVTFRDSTKFPVEGYVAVDRGRDIALLRVRSVKELPALRLAPGLPRKLQQVVALGAPKGLSFSASAGNVSAIRTGAEIRGTFLDTDKADLYGRLGYDSDATWIQTTTPISSGNSGGPLVNMQGDVVGMNTWSRPDGQNLNFAIAAKEIAALTANRSQEVRALTTLPRTSRNLRVGRAVIREPDNPIKITFPSSKILDEAIFAVSIRTTRGWVEEAFDGKGGSVAFLYHANGCLFAVSGNERGELNGPTLAFYENKDPLMYGTYLDGRRHGLLKTWDANGSRVFWCQYAKGKRNGFCCFFKEDKLRLVLECDFDEMKAIHLIADNAVARTFLDIAEAERDDAARSLLNELNTTETVMDENERQFKKAVREEEQRLRQARTAKATTQKRRAISARMATHAAERAAALGALARRAGL